MKIVRITALLAVVLVTTVAFAQKNQKMETGTIEAKVLTDADKELFACGNATKLLHL